MTNIVIVGAGFGGLQTALGLAKSFSGNKNIQITLVDKRDYHLFTSNLYEVASSEDELTTSAQMKKSITLPITQVLKGTGVNFVQAEVLKVLEKDKQLALAGKTIAYDYLVLALGSRTDFFNIQGSEQFALTLKSLPDALRIRNQIEFMVQTAQFEMNKRTLRVVIAGGGYTGLELVSELKGLLDILAMKYQYPQEKIELEVIEANNKVIAGFDPRLSEDAYQRLMELGIRVRLSSKVSAVEQHFVELANGEKVAYDCLIWTTGVRACGIPEGCDFELDAKGRLPVNGYFQIQGYENIFSLGDSACVMDAQGHPAPATAQDAWDQAKFLAKALPYIIKNQKPPQTYVPKKHGFIVALGGKWAIVSYGSFYIKGFFGYIVAQAAHLRYYASLVGWFKALKYILFQVEMYSRND